MNWVEKTDRLLKLIERHRPLNKGELRELQKWYRVGMTYHSNAIEGSTLTEDETRLLVEDGVTVGGKTVREINEALNHADLVDDLYEVAKGKKEISEALIQKWHKKLLSGIDEENAGKYRRVNIFITGSEERFPEPKTVPGLMKDFYLWLSRRNKLHPIVLSAEAHYRFVKIHPYVDGNGRMARLMMNLLLMKVGYPPVIVPIIRRQEYMAVLKKPIGKFTAFISEIVYENVKDYCRMVGIV